MTATESERAAALLARIEERERSARRRALLFTLAPALVAALLLWFTSTQITRAQQRVRVAQDSVEALGASLRGMRREADRLEGRRDSLQIVLRETELALERLDSARAARVQAQATELVRTTGNLTRTTHVVNLFAADPRTRIAAAQALLERWRSDPELVPELLAYASRHPENDNGVYNTVVVLNGLSPGTLRPHRAEVERFLDFAGTRGPKTAGVVEQLRARLGPAARGR